MQRFEAKGVLQRASANHQKNRGYQDAAAATTRYPNSEAPEHDM